MSTFLLIHVTINVNENYIEIFEWVLRNFSKESCMIRLAGFICQRLKVHGVVDLQRDNSWLDMKAMQTLWNKSRAKKAGDFRKFWTIFHVWCWEADVHHLMLYGTVANKSSPEEEALQKDLLFRSPVTKVLRPTGCRLLVYLDSNGRLRRQVTVLEDVARTWATWGRWSTLFMWMIQWQMFDMLTTL